MTKEEIERNYHNAALKALDEFTGQYHRDPEATTTNAQEAIQEAVNWEYLMVPTEDRIRLELKPPVVKVTSFDDGLVFEID